MRRILIEHLPNIPVGRQQVELVERKGVGHPDSICDAIMEAVSVALSQTYIEQAGRVLHHNIDKGLLVAGQTTPALGGGSVDAPMRLVFGDRATTQWNGHHIDVDGIAEATAKQWLRENLRFVDPEKHMVFQNEIQPGSPELMDIFERDILGANDTSAAVGYAPLTETERIVLATERRLNSPEFKAQYPEAGEDVKVMGARQGRELSLTVALAFVDRFVPDEKTYFDRKAAIQQDLQAFLQAELNDLDRIDIDINTLDEPGRGLGGMYLTVLGTSAEGADCGQVGRGNRVNGVISLNRPMGTEAAAGKNPVSHVGKIYNLLSHQIAGKIYEAVDPVEEVYVWLCSQIGHPVDRPWIASAQVVLEAGVELPDVEKDIRQIIDNELADIRSFTDRLARGELMVW
ncbi:MAG: methionine adenosyltransferase [Chloroflexi bacterium]|nr:MAG: methionine adenosyltransferase [Chloroflexota bacterium]